MKWAYKILFIVLLAVTVVSAAGSLYYYTRVNNDYDAETKYEFRTFPKYYFSLIVNTADDVYWQDFKKGATAAAQAYNVAIEFNPVSEPESNRKTVEYIKIATQSKMDGIIVAGESTDEYVKAINETVAENINVVVGTFETTGSYRTAYVGTNNYEYGKDAAELIAQTHENDNQVDLAIILSKKNNQDSPQDPYTQNIVNGLSSGAIKIASTVYRTTDLLGAEDQIRSILTEHPDIDVIFCTNAKDTVSAAHVIVERNLVGKVDIVGTGINEEIVNYIKKGVIFGVLDKNGYEAGYKSVKVLFESMGDTFTSCYFDINTDVYTKENITSYVKP